VQRKSRLDASTFLSLLMFSNRSPQETSLEDLACNFSDRSNKCITKQAIQERFNDHAVAFIESVLADQLSTKLSLIDKETYSNFNRVRIKDSTRYALPENLGTTYTGHGGVSGPAQISIMTSRIQKRPCTILKREICSFVIWATPRKHILNTFKNKEPTI
jgi:hypothetical protein